MKFKNCIILAFDFPPKANTAAQRPYSWAKDFKGHGLNPIVVTSNLKAGAEEVTHEVNDRYEVYRIKTPNLIQFQNSDEKGGIAKLKRAIKKRLQPILHAQYFLGPVKPLFKATLEIIKKYSIDDTILIVTGKPFQLFRVGYDLHKATGIQWIADYRDDWTTTELSLHSATEDLMYKTFSKWNEKKWIGTARFFTTVSEHYVNKIEQLLGEKVKGYEIQNGFFLSEHQKHQHQKFKSLSFVYVGSLYFATQNILQYMEALKTAIFDSNYQPSIDFHFLGTNVPNSIIALFKDKAPSNLNFIFHKRLPKLEALIIQNSCHYAVIVPHTGLKGVPSSKIYEFVGNQMPIVYYPNDHDIIEKITSETGLGITGNNLEEFTEKLKRIFKEKQITHKPNVERIASYSRESATEKLAKLIKALS